MTSPLIQPPRSTWRDYRRRRRLLCGALLAGLAALLAGFSMARARHAKEPFYVGLALFAGAAALGSLPLADFPCPNCGEPFSCRGRARNLFTRRCLHCGHRKWERPGAPGPLDPA